MNHDELVGIVEPRTEAGRELLTAIGEDLEDQAEGTASERATALVRFANRIRRIEMEAAGAKMRLLEGGEDLRDDDPTENELAAIAERDRDLPLPERPTLPFQQCAADRRYLLGLLRECREEIAAWAMSYATEAAARYDRLLRVEEAARAYIAAERRWLKAGVPPGLGAEADKAAAALREALGETER